MPIYLKLYHQFILIYLDCKSYIFQNLILIYTIITCLYKFCVEVVYKYILIVNICFFKLFLLYNFMRFIEIFLLNQLIYANQNKYIYFNLPKFKTRIISNLINFILTTSMFNKSFYSYSYLLLLTFSFFHKEIHSQPL